MILMPECSLLRTYYKEKGNLFQWHALAKQKELPSVVFSSCSPWREGWGGAGSQGAGTQLPAFFFVVWQHPEGHPQPPHEGCCTKTNWAAGRASKRLKLKQKGEDWEKEESMQNRTRFSAMVSAVLTSSWFWGAFMWKMERAKRWKKDFPTRTLVLEKKAPRAVSWEETVWRRLWAAKQGVSCSMAWAGGFFHSTPGGFRSPRWCDVHRGLRLTPLTSSRAAHLPLIPGFSPSRAGKLQAKNNSCQGPNDA